MIFTEEHHTHTASFMYTNFNATAGVYADSMTCDKKESKTLSTKFYESIRQQSQTKGGTLLQQV